MPPDLKVAIVGGGPAGFYAAEAFLDAVSSGEVTMLERLPVPYGLVRSGVAPDHPKLKQAATVYDRIGRSEKVQFIGDVEVGADVSVAELRDTHHCIIFAYGAAGDKSLAIPGEDLRGVHFVRQFVGWYNGHQDHRYHYFDLSHEAVAIIGHGNVALDVARILAKPVDALRQTDIAQHALDALSESRVREIHLFGRRGPLESKFSPHELSEFASIPNCSPTVDVDHLPPPSTRLAGGLDRDAQRKLLLFQQFSELEKEGKLRRVHFHFRHRPISLVGDDRLRGIAFERSTRDGRFRDRMEFPCGLLFQSVGFRGLPIEGFQMDKTGVLRHQTGRLVDSHGTPLHGLYAAGWIKRGASGIIGTNRADSLETIETLLSDLPLIKIEEKSGACGIRSILAARGKTTVDFRQWLQIDRHEVEAGRALGKPREKLTTRAELLAAAQSRSESSSPRL